MVAGLLEGLLAALVAVAAPPRAAAWQPPGLLPSAADATAVAAVYRRANGVRAEYARRTERYAVAAGDLRFDTQAVVRDGDVRFRTSLGGVVYEAGRHAGHRWRRTPSGLVRIVEADVQGDPLDRWPAAPFGFEPSGCTVAGETAGERPTWVLACRAPHDVPRWFDIAKTGGEVVRETMRDGIRVVTFDFDDFRVQAGTRRAYRWRVGGWGGPADVAVEDVRPQPVEPEAVAVPRSAGAVFRSPVPDAVALPARFQYDAILIDVRLDGRRGTFELDTGTTQLIVDEAFARHAGLRPALGHVVASELTAGADVAHAVPMLAVDLGGFGIDGLLGYDFFAGRVVHVDYAAQRADVLPRDHFSPPPGAEALDAPAVEGMPLVTARVGDAAGARFALDTGSRRLLVGRAILDAAQRRPADAGLTALGRAAVLHYLEGPVAARSALATEVGLGPFVVRDVESDIELAAGPGDLELPLDGVIGTDLMGRFEWWFDVDAGHVWLRPRPGASTRPAIPPM